MQKMKGISTWEYERVWLGVIWYWNYSFIERDDINWGQGSQIYKRNK